MCDDSTSLSFLDTTSSTRLEQDISVVDQCGNTLKELFDPVFVNLRVKIPRAIEKIFKGVDRIGFMYDLVDSDYIEVIEMSSKDVFFRILTCEYEHFSFGDKSKLSNEVKATGGRATNRGEIVFVFGRERFKNRCKVEQNKKYKESISKSLKFTEDNIVKELKMKYLEYQIENHINFVFIDDSQLLHTQLRSLVSLRKEESRYIPKTRKFSEDQKREFLKNILETVPGISQSVSNAILEKFSSMNSVVKGLLDKKMFMSIRMSDEHGGLKSVPEKVYWKLYRTFCGNNGDEKI